MKMKTTILFALLIASVTLFGQSDFTGTWKLNVDKTQFNETPGNPGAAKLVVEQKGGTISYQRNDRPKETLKIDSTASIEVVDGDNKTKVSMKIATDKKGLVETRTYTYPETEAAEVAAQKTRIWTLSPDKKTLTITDQIETTKGNNFVMVLVYDKQSVTGK